MLLDNDLHYQSIISRAYYKLNAVRAAVYIQMGLDVQTHKDLVRKFRKVINNSKDIFKSLYYLLLIGFGLEKLAKEREKVIKVNKMQNATKTHRLQLELPESVILLIQEVKFPSLDINQRIRLSIAIDLFTQGSISLAKAAELAETCNNREVQSFEEYI